MGWGRFFLSSFPPFRFEKGLVPFFGEPLQSSESEGGTVVFRSLFAPVF